MVQNLAWAAGYNVVAIPLAAGVLAVGHHAPPAVGAILMSLSTIVVALNAQLLRRLDLRLVDYARDADSTPLLAEPDLLRDDVGRDRKGDTMNRLEERVAVVTGAASGIGRATAERLAREGALAVITDVQDDAGEETADAIRKDGGRAAYLHLDVTDEDGWSAVVESVLADHGHLDILVNNAGMGDLAPIEETTLADWERTSRSTRRACSSA